jgi:hypothetical protein
MILVAVAIFGFILIRLSYIQLNRKRTNMTAGWTEEDFEEEARSEVRLGDHKQTFLYGY